MIILQKEPVFELPQPIKEDTKKYQGYVEKYVNDELSAARFKGYRVPMGIYGQRDNSSDKEKYMIRVRIPGGVLKKEQLQLLNEISKEYAEGFLHFTTRQDIQIHRVDIEDTPEILYKLLDAGLSPRGGGGNTVRNIACSSRAGVHPEEPFDPSPHALALSEYLLTPRSSFNLPRKYKIAFSATGEDEALATVNDLGFIAKEKEGKKGFKVYAAGGMGNTPEIGILLEDFIEEEKIFQVAEAIKRFFDDYGDRENKHQARLRFVRKRLGTEGFKNKYKEYLEEVMAEDIQTRKIHKFSSERKEINDKSCWNNHQLTASNFVFSEKKAGYYSLELTPENGDMKYHEIRTLLNIIKGDEISLRTTNKQGLLIRGIKVTELQEKIEEINNINEDLLMDSDILSPVACKGASTCRLGLCLSPQLAFQIKKQFLKLPEEVRKLLPQVYISGCPNSCGQHHIGKIGFEGKARRNKGRLVPFYTLLLGGRIEEDKSGYGEKVVDLPARKIPEFLRELAQSLKDEKNYSPDNFYKYLEHRGKEKIERIAQRYTSIPDYEENPDIYKDWGQNKDFSLEGRGPGECGTGVLDIVKLDIDNAKDYYQEGLNNKDEDKLYQAVINAARALLIVRGVDTEKDRVVINEFKQKFIDKNLVDSGYQHLLDRALDFKLGDKGELIQVKEKIGQFIQQIENLYNSLDSSLEFKLEVEIEDKSNNEKADENDSGKLNQENQMEEDKLKDLRGVECPLNFVKAKLFIEPLPSKTEITLYLDEGEPIDNVPRSLKKEGHEILEKSKKDEGYYVLKVRKK
ncbi:MAG: sulfurtransferase TusA family protein [Halanaerobiales bacterium]